MSALIKVRDWRKRLSDTIEAARRKPYSETDNCAIFVIDCVQSMTGVDIAKPFRGNFTTIAEAYVLLERAGYADLDAFFAAQFVAITPARAGHGDIATFMVEQGVACGIISGERISVLSERGIGTVSRSLALRAYRVG
jgi:hypothetical protein